MSLPTLLDADREICGLLAASTNRDTEWVVDQVVNMPEPMKILVILRLLSSVHEDVAESCADKALSVVDVLQRWGLNLANKSIQS